MPDDGVDAMTTWKGYTQHPEALEDRPWWRNAPRDWLGDDLVRCRRSDGEGLPEFCCTLDSSNPGGGGQEEWASRQRWTWGPLSGTLLELWAKGAWDALVPVMLAHIDREHPLPPPEPKCGQVLLIPTGGTTTIQSVSPCGLWVALIEWRQGAGMTRRRQGVASPALRAQLVTVHVDCIASWPRVSGEGSPWMDTGGEE